MTQDVIRITPRRGRCYLEPCGDPACETCTVEVRFKDQVAAYRDAQEKKRLGKQQGLPRSRSVTNDVTQKAASGVSTSPLPEAADNPLTEPKGDAQR